MLANPIAGSRLTRLVGLSLTGEAGREPIEAFTGLRDAATRLGMGLEVHAGEHQPASSIVDALDVLQSDRIGHSVTAIDDPMLLDRLVRDQVPLDVCPSSNVAIGIFRRSRRTRSPRSGELA